MMIDKAGTNRKIFLGNPSERQLVGYNPAEWNRNMVSQVATAELNQKASDRQARFDQEYLRRKKSGMSPDLLAQDLREHGRFLADYDDAQIDQNWMQKAYYSIRSMVESDEEAGKAFEEFLQHTRVNREEENVARIISSPDSEMGKHRKGYEQSMKMGL
jgi:hypothetical protein